MNTEPWPDEIVMSAANAYLECGPTMVSLDAARHILDAIRPFVVPKSKYNVQVDWEHRQELMQRIRELEQLRDSE